jgi:hypothetical protein
LFSVSEFVAAAIARLYSGSVAAVIVGNAIAAPPVRSKLAVSNAAVPTAVINGAPKVDKTIAIGNRSIDVGGG